MTKPNNGQDKIQKKTRKKAKQEEECVTNKTFIKADKYCISLITTIAQGYYSFRCTGWGGYYLRGGVYSRKYRSLIPRPDLNLTILVPGLG